jgi:hypothetical protein
MITLVPCGWGQVRGVMSAAGLQKIAFVLLMALIVYVAAVGGR